MAWKGAPRLTSRARHERLLLLSVATGAPRGTARRSCLRSVSASSTLPGMCFCSPKFEARSELAPHAGQVLDERVRRCLEVEDHRVARRTDDDGASRDLATHDPQSANNKPSNQAIHRFPTTDYRLPPTDPKSEAHTLCHGMPCRAVPCHGCVSFNFLAHSRHADQQQHQRVLRPSHKLGSGGNKRSAWVAGKRLCLAME